MSSAHPTDGWGWSPGTGRLLSQAKHRPHRSVCPRQRLRGADRPHRHGTPGTAPAGHRDQTRGRSRGCCPLLPAPSARSSGPERQPRPPEPENRRRRRFPPFPPRHRRGPRGLPAAAPVGGCRRPAGEHRPWAAERCRASAAAAALPAAGGPRRSAGQPQLGEGPAGRGGGQSAGPAAGRLEPRLVSGKRRRCCAAPALPPYPAPSARVIPSAAFARERTGGTIRAPRGMGLPAAFVRERRSPAAGRRLAGRGVAFSWAGARRVVLSS